MCYTRIRLYGRSTFAPILGFTVEALKLDNEAQNIRDYLRDIGSWNIFSAGIIVVSHIHVASHHSRL